MLVVGLGIVAGVLAYLVKLRRLVLSNGRVSASLRTCSSASLFRALSSRTAPISLLLLTPTRPNIRPSSTECGASISRYPRVLLSSVSLKLCRKLSSLFRRMVRNKWPRLVLVSPLGSNR